MARKKKSKGLALACTLALALWGARGQPNRGEIVLVCATIAACLLYSFSGWTLRSSLGMAEKLGRWAILGVVCVTISAAYGYYFWPFVATESPKESSAPANSLTEPRAETSKANKPAIPEEKALAVVVELRVFGPSTKGYFSGHWFQWNRSEPCVISPINALLFIRITNLKTTRTTITGYRVEAKDINTQKWNELKRFDLRSGYLLFTGRRGLRSSAPRIGNVVNLPGKCGYFLVEPTKDAILQTAAVIDASLLDNELGGKPLESGDSARGWSAFEFRGRPDMRGELRVTVDDVNGNQYSTTSKKLSNSKETCLGGDIMPHLLRIVDLRDVSSCQQKPAY